MVEPRDGMSCASAQTHGHEHGAAAHEHVHGAAAQHEHEHGHIGLLVGAIEVFLCFFLISATAITDLSSNDI